MATSAGMLFAYVFAFSLAIVQDSSTKSKSCYISYEKSAVSPGSLGKCIIVQVFFPQELPKCSLLFTKKTNKSKFAPVD